MVYKYSVVGNRPFSIKKNIYILKDIEITHKFFNKQKN